MNRFGTNAAAVTAAVRRRLAGQSGFGLIEVMVSAALLVVVLVALSAGIDGPSEVAARNQQRAVATTLSQQDQDRMRAMRTVDLADYAPAARQVNVNGVNYTVTSRGSWYRDASGSLSCTNNSAVVQYIDITSTVTWPAMRGPAVTLESLAAPKTGAFNLIAQIVDEKGNAVSGLPVTTNGTANATRITNSFGCAVFGGMPTGPYTLTFNKQGWVDPDGVTSPLVGATVAADSTTTVSHQYAAGATLTVNFDTQAQNGTVMTGQLGRSATVTNTGLSAGLRVFPPGAPGAPSTSISTAPQMLFPFTTGYGVYAGNCTSNAPSAANTAQVATPYAGTPSVTVREPMINLQIKRGAGNYQSPHVTIKQNNPTGCNGAAETYPAQAAAASGTLSYPVPYGTYAICADDGLGASSRRGTATVTNASPGGTATQTVTIPTSGSATGPCP